MEQFDLFFTEWSHLPPVDADSTYQFLLLEHRHDDHGPHPSKCGKGGAIGIVSLKRWVLTTQVRNMDWLFGHRDAHQRTGTHYRFVSSKLNKCRWSIVQRDYTERIAFIES